MQHKHVHQAYIALIAPVTVEHALQDKECKATKSFGDSESGVLASWPGQTFDLSQIYNTTESATKSSDFDWSNWLSTFLGDSTPESSAVANATVTVTDGRK